MSFVRQEGLIKTEVVYAILLRSNLPREVLGYIWDMCNKTTPGQLTREELFLILAMISIAQVSLIISVLLLISAASLGVYYCQQLTLSVCPSVRMSVRLSRSFKLLLLFCFSMESSHFLAIISPCALYKTLFSDF